MENKISHEGIVYEVNDDEYKVKILAKSACVSCQIKGSCNLSDMEEKEVNIKRHKFDNWQIGQRVNVVMSGNTGNKAIIWGYLMPFVFLIIGFFISNEVFKNESIAGLLSLAFLVLYYLGLWLFRSKIKNQFSFKLEKLEDSEIFSKINF